MSVLISSIATHMVFLQSRICIAIFVVLDAFFHAAGRGARGAREVAGAFRSKKARLSKSDRMVFYPIPSMFPKEAVARRVSSSAPGGNGLGYICALALITAMTVCRNI